MIRISIILRSGEVFSADFKRMPSSWKSAALRLAPYGSDVQGCTYNRERI
jgi:hypothetical protein